MPEQTLAQRIRAKYPGEYDDLGDVELETKVLAKYPEYEDLPRAEQPSLISRATQGVSNLAQAAGQGIGDLFQAATTPIPTLETAKEAVTSTAFQGEQTHPLAKFGKAAVEAMFPTSALDVGLAVLPGAAGPAAKGIRALRGAYKVADTAGDIAKVAQIAPKVADTAQDVAHTVKATIPIAERIAIPATPKKFGPGPRGQHFSDSPSQAIQLNRQAMSAQRRGDIDLAQKLRQQAKDVARETRMKAREATVSAQPSAQPLGQPRLIKDTGKFFRQLSPEDQATVMANRQKWSADLAAAGIKETPQLTHRLDQLGVKYRQHQDTFQQLKSLATGQADETALATAQQQARSLGAQLGGMRSLVKGGRVKSEEALLKAVEKALDEAGSAAGQLVTRIATAGAGAAAGGAVGDTPEERMRNAAIGGVGGALAPSAIRGAGRAIKALKPQNLEDYVYFSLLSNPVTAAKANLGSIGAVFVKGTELITEGLGALNPKLIVQGGKALKELLPGSESMRLYFRALKNPEVAQQIVGETGKVPGTGLTGQTVGRLFSAGDAAAVNALRKAGIGVDEARTLTLAGDPTSKLGQATMKGLETVKREGGALGRAAVPLVSPFPRVGIQALERGLERTPLGLLRRNVPMARKAAQAGTGAAAGAAGFAAQDELPAWAVPLVGAAAGPAVLPFMIGHGLALAQQGGGAGPKAVTGAVSENLPVGGEALRSFIDPASIMRRLVPGAVGAVARHQDPAFGRETGGQALKDAGVPEPLASVVGPAASMIPGVRQQLPEKFDPVSAFGQPRSEPQGAIGRALVPTQQRFVPGAMGGNDPLLQQLRDMGIELTPPRMPTKEAKEVGRQGRLDDLRIDGEIQRMAVEDVLSIPGVQNAPPELIREAILERKAEIKKELQ